MYLRLYRKPTQCVNTPIASLKRTWQNPYRMAIIFSFLCHSAVREGIGSAERLFTIQPQRYKLTSNRMPGSRLSTCFCWSHLYSFSLSVHGTIGQTKSLRGGNIVLVPVVLLFFQCHSIQNTMAYHHIVGEKYKNSRVQCVQIPPAITYYLNFMVHSFPHAFLIHATRSNWKNLTKTLSISLKCGDKWRRLVQTFVRASSFVSNGPFDLISSRVQKVLNIAASLYIICQCSCNQRLTD